MRGMRSSCLKADTRRQRMMHMRSRRELRHTIPHCSSWARSHAQGSGSQQDSRRMLLRHSRIGTNQPRMPCTRSRRQSPRSCLPRMACEPWRLSRTPSRRDRSCSRLARLRQLWHGSSQRRTGARRSRPRRSAIQRGSRCMPSCPLGPGTLQRSSAGTSAARSAHCTCQARKASRWPSRRDRRRQGHT